MPTRCCTDPQDGCGQTSSGVLVKCFANRYSWHTFACQPLCQPSARSCGKQPKGNDKYRERRMFISQQDLEKSALPPAQRQTPVLLHLAPSRRNSCEAEGINRVSTSIDAALNPKDYWASLKLWWDCHCRRSSDRLKHCKPQCSSSAWNRAWLSWQDHCKSYFFGPLWSQSASSQLPWKAGCTHPSDFPLKKDGQSSLAACEGRLKETVWTHACWLRGRGSVKQSFHLEAEETN